MGTFENLLVERTELDIRIKQLTEYTEVLNDEDRLLNSQLNAMKIYSSILQMRIEELRNGQ